MPTSNFRDVIVVGGGIAGLSAAHELAVRGFKVTVYESHVQRVGGIAASQPCAPPNGPASSFAAREAVGYREQPPGPHPLPGEHGYRFFPSFYRHLTDIMERTPILETRGGALEPAADGRTAASNLVPTYLVGYATGDGMVEHTYRRTEMRLVEMVRFIRDYLTTAGIDSEDIVKMQLTLIEYATSCEARRKELELVSWWNYARAFELNLSAQEWLQKTPEALVAMDAQSCDARTYGTVSLQMLFDQMGNGDQTDRTLNGPTSKAWLDRWHEFLEKKLKVKFMTGWELKRMGVSGANELMSLTFAQSVPTSPPRPDIVLQRNALNPLNGDFKYVVCALPLTQADAVLAASAITPTSPPTDVEKLRAFAALKSFGKQSGIQFFLKEKIEFVRGHIYCPKSEWGLSAISQGQFWREDLASAYPGVASVISVDIGVWDVPGTTGVTAENSDRAQIAQEVWQQLRNATDASVASLMGASVTPRHTLPAEPWAWHLADEIQPLGFPPPRNVELLINKPGEWDVRPGRIADEMNNLPEQDYEMQLGGSLVFCGPHMKTFTRLTTMEAANESARHAVNAILAASAYPGDGCTVWPTEYWELPELDALIALDRRLYADGKPHFLRIIHAREWLDALML